MFSYIIATNKVTDNVTSTLEILSSTKKEGDRIILINYNNYNIKYRSLGNIEYHHIKKNKDDAINSILPKDSDVVILDGSGKISKSFVSDLYKHYNRESLWSLRTDTMSINGKFVESDVRIGSIITPSSFKKFLMAFNTSVISKIGSTPKETAIMALQNDVPLGLLSNVRVFIGYKIQQRGKKSLDVGITILIPSLSYEYVDTIKSIIRPNDKIIEFNGNFDVAKFINRKIQSSNNDCILLINPASKIENIEILSRIRNLYDPNRCILFDVGSDLTEHAWLSFPKSLFNHTETLYTNVYNTQKSILSYNEDAILLYRERLDKKADRAQIDTSIKGMISIIIPFMYNGDRWPLFMASLDKLYECTKNHDNIEIIVHETGSKQSMKPTFINKYELVYLFSKHSGKFDRAWNLNVAARHVSKGDTLVFFDADLIIDDQWVNELLFCGNDRPYIGWDTMKNLNKTGTNIYLKTKNLTENIERTRKPNILAAAAGINVIPRDIFFSIGGWPESYKGMGYGGEDNSFVVKMIKMGYLSDNINKHTFKSTVYHLYHDHRTVQDKASSGVFQKHKEYNRDDWIQHIKKHYNWGEPVSNIQISKKYINETLISLHKIHHTPSITLCMVNFMRYEILIDNLKNLLSLGVSINLLLWVNKIGDMPDDVRSTVVGLLSKFTSSDLMGSNENLGTGYPRYMMISKARYEYKTDYIMTIDDDIFHQNPESLVLGASILDQEEYQEYGAIGVWCEPLHDMFTIKNKKLISFKPKEGLHTVDLLGAAAMTVRKDVIDVCNVDPRYKIGLVDWDFSMSIRNYGYKLGLVCDDLFMPVNDISKNTDDYQNNRYDDKTITNSKTLFDSKWGIEIK